MNTPTQPNNNMNNLLNHLANRGDFTESQMRQLMQSLMAGELSDVQAASLLMGLRCKGESVDEIFAAASVMRECLLPVTLPSTILHRVIDIVGTGGDGAHTMNVSTAASFVVASKGVPVAKHGNRSVSSSCGAADVLEALGAKLDFSPVQIASCIEKVGFGFMFAPVHHPAMKHVVPIRRQMGIRTIFNILGPLTNPASVRNMVLGVYSPHWLEPIANVLHKLGVQRALVVYGDNGETGVDELSLCGSSQVAEVNQGHIVRYTLQPEDVQLETIPNPSVFRVHNVQEAQDKFLQALDGRNIPCRNLVALNAGAAFYVVGLAPTIKAGIAMALEQITSGAATEKLRQFIQYTQEQAQ